MTHQAGSYTAVPHYFIKAVARAAIPSPRPRAPRPSEVVALTLTEVALAEALLKLAG